jgi:hypothetical protein
VLILLVSAAMVGLSLLRGMPDHHGVARVATPAPIVQSPSPSPTAQGSQEQGDFPRSGSGMFLYERTDGPPLGEAGELRRFKVAVESNLPGEIEEFTRMVDVVLGDPRSWIAGRQLRFQRVADGEASDFTIHLVTRSTAYKMCSVAGLDIRLDGVPFTSCRTTHKVVINLDRWRLSVPDYVSGGIPLRTYREYVINHEVGHELGHGHEACPGPGLPAPTMSTQTLGLRGCNANPWPYVDGKRYAGAAVP